MRDHTLDYLEHPTDDGRTELAELYNSYRSVHPPLNSSKLARASDTDNDEDQQTFTGEQCGRCAAPPVMTVPV